jgi:hypothetical protein
MSLALIRSSPAVELNPEQQLAVEMIPSLAPSTAARSQAVRWT